MATIEELEERLNTFEETLIQLSRDMVPVVGKVDHTANDVEALTPYKDTKTAYYGDTECIFYDAPEGNISVFGDIGEYTTNRLANRLYVYFKPLGKQTDITISIS